MVKPYYFQVSCLEPLYSIECDAFTPQEAAAQLVHAMQLEQMLAPSVRITAHCFGGGRVTEITCFYEVNVRFAAPKTDKNAKNG